MKCLILAWLGLLVPAATSLGQQLPLQPSYCDGVLRPQGIGYTPPPGSRSCLFVSPNGGGHKECYPMDVGVHCFGELGQQYNHEGCLRRYGPNFHGADVARPRFLSTDFETIFEEGSVTLQRRCCQNQWGTAKTRSCYPLLHELHDWFAVNPEVISSSGARPRELAPAAPTVVRVSSPEPGRVKLTWRARAEPFRFEIEVIGSSGSLVFPIDPLPTREAVLLLPPGVGGELSVRVRSLIADITGPWSATRPVRVVPLGIPVEPEEPSVPSPPVPAPETPAPPVELTTVFCVRYQISGGGLTMEKINCP